MRMGHRLGYCRRDRIRRPVGLSGCVVEGWEGGCACGVGSDLTACDYVAVASRRNTGRILTERYRGFASAPVVCRGLDLRRRKTDDGKNPNRLAADRADPWRAAELMSPPRAATVSVVLSGGFATSWAGPHALLAPLLAGLFRARSRARKSTRGFWETEFLPHPVMSLSRPAATPPTGRDRDRKKPRVRAGLFHAGPPRSARPTVRLGVEVVGLLCFGGIVRALYGKTQDGATYPASDFRHRNQLRGSVFRSWVCRLAGKPMHDGPT